MSVLTDPDFLLHTLQLSYVRHVLPNHSSLSATYSSTAAGAGTAAYDLVAFAPAADLAARNPYIALSGTADPQRWPELEGSTGHGGRSSPPLLPLLARDAGGPTRPRAGGLQYSQTIGKGLTGAGIRVQSGRPRTWKGRGQLSRGDNAGEASAAVPSPALPGNGLQPPPVVIHSPTKTPRPTPALRLAGPSPAPLASVHSRPSLSSSISTTDGGADPSSPASLSEYRAPLSANSSRADLDIPSKLTPIPPPRRRQRRASDELSASRDSDTDGSADSDFPDGPTLQDPPRPAPTTEVPVFQLPPGLRVRERRRVNIRPGEILAARGDGPVPAPTPSPRPPSPAASSIDSDFGVPVGPPAAERRIEPPSAQTTTGLRLRERRRVNIRPGQILAPAPPFPAATPPQAPPSPSSSPDSDFADRRPTTTPQLPLPRVRMRERRRVHVPPGGLLADPASAAAVHTGSSETPLVTIDTTVAEASVARELGHLQRPRQTSNASSSVASDFGGGLPSPLTPATPAPLAPTPLTHPSGGIPAPPPLSPERDVPPPPQQQQEGGREPQAVAPFQLPPGVRVRERRRVNVRPGAVLASVNGAPVDAAREIPADSSPAASSPDSSATAAAAADPVLPTAAPAPVASLRALPARRRSSRPSSPAANAGPYFPPRAAYLNPTKVNPTKEATPAPPPRSALSALLAAQDAALSASTRGVNPFSTLYAACVVRTTSSPGTALPLRLFFPETATDPDRPLEIHVKRDVLVEEVLGAGLWAYWEEGREPPLEGIVEEEARDGRETAKWALRIVEDGEVDEDFPALERTRAISAFAFSEFAIVRAEEEQIEDNLAKQATIVRRPSRILASAPAVSAGPPNSGAGDKDGGSAALDRKTCAAGSALAVPVQLKITVPPLTAAEGLVAREQGEETGAHLTVQVPSDMYLIDALDVILRKRGIRSPSREWALVVRLQDGDLVVPLDRTVESLGEQRELELVPRARVGPGGLRKSAGATGDNRDPSQSIFPSSRLADVGAQPAYPSAAAAAVVPYLHFNVLRKLPMSLGGRHARVIAIDGDYLHFMPADGNLPALSRGRTTSFHVSAIHSCKVSRRSASSFKIVVHTKRGVDKRYDFEAENPERAREIVEVIRRVMEFYRAERRAR